MAEPKQIIYQLYVILVATVALFGSTAVAATLQTYQRDKKIKSEALTLEQALAKLRAQGPEYKKFQSEIDAAEYAYRKAKFTYWMPTGSFSATLGSESTFARYKGGYPDVKGTRDRFFGPNSATATLNLLTYTLFDGGSSTLDLQKAALEYQKALDLAKYKKLAAERKLVDTYFAQRTFAESLDATFRSFQLWRTVEQLISASSASGPEVEADMGEVKIQLNETEQSFSKYDTGLSEKAGELNVLMGEPPQKKFNLVSDIKIAPLALSLTDAMAQVELTNSDAIEKRHDLRVMRIDAQKEIMDMGLKPKISFGGIQYTYTFSQNSTGSGGTPTTMTAGDSASSNFVVKFDMSLSADLFGPSGFFKHFERVEKQRNILVKEREVIEKRQEWEQKLLALFEGIKREENDTRLVEDSLRQTVKQLDRFLDRMSSGAKTNVRDIKDYVGGSLKRNIELLEKKQAVLRKRFELDELLGVDTTKTLGENLR
jgi:outer membrane protein TolC